MSVGSALMVSAHTDSSSQHRPIVWKVISSLRFLNTVSKHNVASNNMHRVEDPELSLRRRADTKRWTESTWKYIGAPAIQISVRN
ncbi:hypothetical protein DICSQDRAFT_130838 [Dichomitus squalens LYAD-421 SS1]|uniref:uncharacterized protein n=1 Tax=Dichomitus squalens (strain LYAD-421) TaxID=732165 RepID=UPI0004412616|nr:uncharacterized protein DICSQDRAFT_130838 [Dichomitus squalens LYAD-421 SS1]EJF66581.1 hypothetical protein DICSQDRAFT_130838 [Dichomitus squalens LYAD-421 SS1]